MSAVHDPLAAFARGIRSTPQSQPIPTRTDQVQNSAAGYVFAVDDWTRLHRFLIIGVDGGTYYIGESDLTRQNATTLVRCIAEDGPRVVEHVKTLSLSGDAPKQEPLLFALAMCAASTDKPTADAAFAAVNDVCRTGTQLFTWNAYLEQMRGWGPARKRAVAGWYERDDVAKVAYQAVKYRQRAGWSHRDLLRLARPKPVSPQHQALFRWITQRKPAENALVGVVDAFDRVQSERVTKAEVVDAIIEWGLPWEALPDRWLNEHAIWQALLPKLGATALLRQLPRLTRLRVIQPYGPLPASVDRLRDVEFLRRGRIHPVAVLNALMAYGTGSARSGGDFVIVPEVLNMLEDAFYASFGALEPTGLRYLVAVDVSGSMTWESSRLPKLPALTCRDAAAAMAMSIVRSEPNVIVTAFADGIKPLPITNRTRLTEAISIADAQPATRTDCALPMLWAGKEGINDVDVFVIFTDNETWYGQVHPTQALGMYRQVSGRPARLAVNGMVSNGFSIADPTDAGQLDMVGFDAAMPRILSAFAAGRI